MELLGFYQFLEQVKGYTYPQFIKLERAKQEQLLQQWQETHSKFLIENGF